MFRPISCWPLKSTVPFVYSVALFLFFSCMLATSQSPASPGASADAGESLKPGVVIEKIDNPYAGTEQAGMKAGDVLLRWSRAGNHGELTSPFDIYKVISEQLWVGPVEFEGFRGSEQRKWTVAKQYWATLLRPNFPDRTLAAYREGTALAQAGELVEAGKRWRAAGDEAVKTQPSWVRTWFIEQAAKAFADGQLWKEAEAGYLEVIAQSAEIGLAVEANFLYEWGRDFQLRSDWASAEKYYALAFDKSLQAGSRNFAGGLMNTRGLVARSRGDLSLAEQYLWKGWELRESVAPGSLAAASSFISLGIVISDRGDLEKAEEYYNKARAAYDKVAPGSVGLAYILDDLGELNETRGDLAKADAYLRQSLAIMEIKDPGTREHATVLNSLAGISDLSGNGTEAETLSQKALAIMQKLLPEGSPEEASSWEKLGNLAMHRNDLSTAEQDLLRALAIKEKVAANTHDIADTLHSLGYLNFYRHDLEKADAYYRRALAIREKLAAGSIQHAESLAAIAQVLRRRNQIPSAAQYYDQALTALESQTARLGGTTDVRAGFRARHEAYYREYIDLLVGQNQTARAFDVLERSRARTLLETLAAAHIDVHQGVDPALTKQERSLQADIRAKSNRRIDLLSEQHSEQQITDVEKEISSLTTAYNEVEAQIRAGSPGYAALTQPQPLGVEATKKELPDSNTILLEYSLGEERSYLFSVTANSLQAYVLPARSEIEKQALHVRELLTERNRAVKGESEAQKLERWRRAERAYGPAAAQLGRVLLGPVAGTMKDHRLVIVADGALHYIPFAALPEPGALPAQPLAVKHEIVTLPSASVLALLRQRNQSRKPAPLDAAVLADPVFEKDDSRIAGLAKPPVGSQTLSSSLLTRSAQDFGLERDGRLSLPRLRFSRLEADAIYRLTPPGRGMEAVDFQASREAAINPDLAKYRIIHFATHGLLNSQHPELSGLVFSLVDKNGQPQDGFLGLQDIYNLNLPADLVVLSACETGLGKEISGEGLVGLTRGFMYAGATRVVASLWNVSDVATSKLMAEFYRAMEKDHMPPAAALRTAQISLLKQPRWSHPYYWAAFQIQGEWK